MATAAGQNAVWIIRTKLDAPVARGFVQRERLLDLVSAAPRRRLTLICAPAGWGKTVLLSEWRAYESEDRPFAWLSLDDGDDDPVKFWAYVIEALRTVTSETFGAGAVALLRAPGVNLREEMVPALLNELASAGREIVIALDDYHLIHNPQVHDQVAAFLEHLPRTVSLVLATRVGPPLPLARLRARGDLLEIEAQHLQFTEAEAAQLLNGVHRLGLERDDVARLRERTEGWATGLYLAILSMYDLDDRRSFIAGFAGDHSHVFEYLRTEVLAGQPDEVRAFLARSSVLERLCGPLCDATVGVDNGTELLAQLERSNHFLIALDDRGEWYRYHHLFKEHLQRELRSSESPELIAGLHRRAAGWLAGAGYVAEAIEHLTTAPDYPEAVELILRHWLPTVNASNHASVQRWLDALPEGLVTQDARLALVTGWAAFGAGRLDDVLPAVELAQRAPLPAPFPDRTTSVASGAATLQASYWLLVGDMTRCRAFASTATELERAAHWRAIASNCLGTSAYWLERPVEAAALLDEAVRLTARRIPIAAIFARGHLALIAADRGDWARAGALCDDTIETIAASSLEEHWVGSAARLAHARLLERRGALTEALSEAERGLALARRGSGPVDQANAQLIVARLRANDDVASARELVRETQALIDRLPDPGPLIRRLAHEASRPARSRSRPSA